MKSKDLREYLTKYIGFSSDDFKYFGDGFQNYEEFRQFQLDKIFSLSKPELMQLKQLIGAVQTFKPRHIDFYNITEQYVINGVYFTKNNKLMTFSTV